MPLNPSINPWQNGSSNSIFYNAGHVGIGTTSPSTTLHVQGDMLATAYYLISDETLKENIVPIQDALQKLESINGYSFTWK